MGDWIDDAFSDDEDLQIIATRAAPATKRKTTKSQPKRSVKQVSKRNTKSDAQSDIFSEDDMWIKKYSPKSIDTVAGNKAKIDDLANWFADTVIANPGVSGEKILLITGPSGCGKTSAVQAICDDLKISIQQWTNESREFIPVEERGDNSVEYQSQIALFESFLIRANKYQQISLLGPTDSSRQTTYRCQQQIILVEDIPNQYNRSPAEWHSRLRWFYKISRNLLVVIYNTSGEVSERSMFPEYLQTELKIKHVTFNPVPKTDIKRVLTSIKEDHPQLDISSDYIISLSESCDGDIRSAINTLQFTFDGATNTEETTSKPTTKKPRLSAAAKKLKSSSNNSKDKQLAESHKDPTVILFRALGKVLYCKREEGLSPDEGLLSSHLQHHSRRELSFNPEQIYEQCKVSSDFYVLSLHQNFPSFLPDLENAKRALEYLTDSDCMTERYGMRKDEGKATPALSVAARGLIHSNTCINRKNTWMPMRKPQWYSVRKKKQDYIEELKYVNKTSYTERDLVTDIIPALQLMKISNPLSQVLPPYATNQKYQYEKLDEKDIKVDIDLDITSSISFFKKPVTADESRLSAATQDMAVDDPAEFTIEEID